MKLYTCENCGEPFKPAAVCGHCGRRPKTPHELAPPFELDAAEKLALKVAAGIAERGEPVGANTSAVLVCALNRAQRAPTQPDAKWLANCSLSGLHLYARDVGFAPEREEDETAFRLRLITAVLNGDLPPHPLLALAPGQPQPDAPTDITKLPDYWDERRRLQGKPDLSRCAAELRIALARKP